MITVAKVRGLHYPRKLRVTNSKHLDDITPVLEDQIDNDSFWLLLLDFHNELPHSPQDIAATPDYSPRKFTKVVI